MRNELHLLRQAADQLRRPGRQTLIQRQQLCDAKQIVFEAEQAVAQAKERAIERVSVENPVLFEQIQRLRNEFNQAKQLADQLRLPGRRSVAQIQALQHLQETENALATALRLLDQVIFRNAMFDKQSL